VTGKGHRRAWAGAGKAHRRVSAGAAALLALPEPASACSSCFLAGEAARQAYYSITLLLVAVPLLLALAIGIWLRPAAQQRARQRRSG
jgi:hypothetical protein